MPLQVELEARSQCSYFSFCSMDDVTTQDDGVTQQLVRKFKIWKKVVILCLIKLD